jgi:MFS family permease
MFEVIWQPYVLSLGATVPILGMLQGFEMAVRSVLQLVWGRVSDAVGRKKPILASCALSLVGLVPFFAARSWIWMVPTLAIWALADSIWEPVFPTLVSESVEADERGTAFSLISLLWFLPGFFAPALGGFMAQSLGYRSIIGSMFVFEAASSLIFLLYVRETYSGSGRVRFGQLLSSLKGVLDLPSKGLSRFYVASTVYQFSWIIGEGILYAMLLKSFGLTLIQIGILANVFSVAAALMQFPIGKLANSVSAEERARSYGDLNCLKGLICFPAPILAAILFDRVGFWAPISIGLALDLVVVGILISMGGQSSETSSAL